MCSYQHRPIRPITKQIKLLEKTLYEEVFILFVLITKNGNRELSVKECINVSVK